jgi:outer membrane protein insertion porin family
MGPRKRGFQRFAPSLYAAAMGSLLAGTLICSSLAGAAQSAPSQPSAAIPDASGQQSLRAWEGKPILRVDFTGVAASRMATLPQQLALQAGAPLHAQAVSQTLRRLYATGLYDTVAIQGELESGGVVLTVHGTPRTFIGIVSVTGAKGANTNSLLERVSRLTPGTRFILSSLDRAEAAMRHSLAQSGYYEPVFTHTLTEHPADQLVDIAYTVDSGPQSRVGTVDVTGESGLSPADFLKYSKLKPGQKVTQDTSGKALDGIENYYRKSERLEAEVKLESKDYVVAQKAIDFQFSANRGPIVHVLVDGVTLSQEKIRKLLPIYQEGSVDDDLLNEGNRRLENYYQRLGYFDVKATHDQRPPTADLVEIVFHVNLGARHRVGSVTIEGAKYFDLPTLQERLSVRPHDAFDREGVYNQALLAQDVASLQAIYQNNGFSQVKITPETLDEDNQGHAITANPTTKPIVPAKPSHGKDIGLRIVYHIEEGPQQRVHAVQITGTEKIDPQTLANLLNTSAGQPLSPESLAGDRETLLTYYLSRGFDQAQVEVTQTILSEAIPPAEIPAPANASKEHTEGPAKEQDSTRADESKEGKGASTPEGNRKKLKPLPEQSPQVDIAFHITEGEQVFLRRVLITGLHYTHPSTIARAITLKEGQPLDQTALLDTQRNLYDLALFNEVTPVIQNPTGVEPSKTVLLQTTEARRWDLSYGGGFELQTGTVNGGNSTGPNGTVGASPRGVLQVSRINLFGRDQTISLRGNLGLLEQRVDFVYQYPHIFGGRNFNFSFTAGYNNSQNIVTYSASQLEGSLRLTEKFSGDHLWLSKANTFVYQFVYRRVKVDQNSIQLPTDEIPILLEAVRVGGPSFNWVRDTRDAPLDAHRGTYTSFQEFISSAIFDSQANFNQVDISNSSYYQFNHDRFVLARNTRYGQERAYGRASDE